MIHQIPGVRRTWLESGGFRRFTALLLCSAALGACSLAGFPQYRDIDVQSSHSVPPDGLETGIAHLKAERNGKAVAVLEDVVLSEPENLRALNALATGYDRMGRHDLAVRLYHRALSQAPDDPATLNNLGYSYLLQGRRDLAISYLAVAEERLAEDSGASAAQLNRVRVNLAAAEHEASTSAPALAFAGSPPGLGRLTAPDSRVTLPHLLRSGQSAQFLMTQEASLASTPGVTFELAGSEPESASAGGTPARRDVRRAASLTVTTREPARDGGPKREALDTARIELSNGAGMRGMAASIARHLNANGIGVARLTNAQRFSHGETTVFHRPGFAEAASRLARALGVASAVRPQSDLDTDIRIRLGGDLVPLARQLQANQEEAA